MDSFQSGFRHRYWTCFWIIFGMGIHLCPTWLLGNFQYYWLWYPSGSAQKIAVGDIMLWWFTFFFRCWFQSMLVRKERSTLGPSRGRDRGLLLYPFLFQHVLEAMEWVIHHYANNIQFYISIPGGLNNTVTYCLGKLWGSGWGTTGFIWTLILIQCAVFDL